MCVSVCVYTGVDPTPEQWEAIAEICKRKNHLPFFDVAYQVCVCVCVCVCERLLARCVVARTRPCTRSEHTCIPCTAM